MNGNRKAALQKQKPRSPSRSWFDKLTTNGQQQVIVAKKLPPHYPPGKRSKANRALRHSSEAASS
jgi:hypothetical protein